MTAHDRMARIRELYAAGNRDGGLDDEGKAELARLVQDALTEGVLDDPIRAVMAMDGGRFLSDNLES